MHLCYVFSFKLLIINTKENGFFRNLGNNKQPHLESTLAWIWSMNLWMWSCLVCLRSWGSFQGRLFGLCTPWCVCLLQSLFWSSGDKTANKSLRITELERTSKRFLFLRPHIQGGEFVSHSRQAVTDPVFVTHPGVDVLIVPKWLRKMGPKFRSSYPMLKLTKCQQWWER